ncbi:MAG: hypothetical protein WAM11_10290 [Cyanobium sp.]
MFPFPSPGLLLRSRLSAVALVASLGGSALALPLAALAQPVGQPGKTRPTPAQLQKIFPELRSLQLQDRRARIATMQAAERCIQAATNAEALQSCMKQERSVSMAQRQQHFNSMRQLFERNGLPLPEMGRGGRGNRPGTPGSSGAAPGAQGAGVQL